MIFLTHKSRLKEKGDYEMVTNDATALKIKHELLYHVAKMVFEGTYEEQKEQQELYTTIKKIAEIEKRSPREVTTRFIERLKRNYGIVIDQVKKDLMMEYNVGRGEGKAPNALEALAMSKYLPVAKSVVATMLEECKKVI